MGPEFGQKVRSLVPAVHCDPYHYRCHIPQQMLPRLHILAHATVNVTLTVLCTACRAAPDAAYHLYREQSTGKFRVHNIQLETWKSIQVTQGNTG